MLVTFPAPSVTSIESISLVSNEYVRVVKSTTGHVYPQRFRDGGFFSGRIQFEPVGTADADVLAATRLQTFLESLNDVVPGRIPFSELDLTKVGVGSSLDAMGNPETITNANRIVQDAGLNGFDTVGTPTRSNGRLVHTVDMDVPMSADGKYINVDVSSVPRLCSVRRLTARTIELSPDYRLPAGTTLETATTLRFQLLDYDISRQNIVVHSQTQIQQNIFLSFTEPGI